MKVINNGKSVIVTQELIKLGESGNGGWNKKQLAIIGIDWPPQKGWRDRVEGTVISNEDATRFVSLKKKAKDGGVKKNKKEIKKKSEPLFIKVDKNLSLEEQYRHPNWQKLRLMILQRDKFSCRGCGDNQSQLHVHHLKYDRNKKSGEQGILI